MMTDPGGISDKLSALNIVLQDEPSASVVIGRGGNGKELRVQQANPVEH